MTADDDLIVADYLRRLRAAASGLPADRRAELVEEITSHVAEARAGAGTAGAGPASVRNILDRLGDPAEIVRAAADALPGNPAATASADGRGRAGGLEIAAVILLLVGGIVVPIAGWLVGVVLLWASPRWRTRDKLLGTLVWPGGLLAPAGLLLIAGAGTLVASSSSGCGSGPVLTGSLVSQDVGVAYSSQSVSSPPHDRSFLAHHVIPTSTCTSSAAGLPPWLVITIATILLAAAVGGPVFTAVRLLRRARQVPHEVATDPAAFQPA
jgi:hypothetical protein